MRTTVTPREQRIVLAPGALSRQEAARYVGVSATTFDALVEAGEMPKPRRYQTVNRVIWLVRELDDALSDLPGDEVNDFDSWEGVKL